MAVHIARIDAAITTVREHGLTGDVATLAMYVAHRDGTGGGCYAGVERMMSDLGWSYRRVNRARGELMKCPAFHYERAGRAPSVFRFLATTTGGAGEREPATTTGGAGEDEPADVRHYHRGGCTPLPPGGLAQQEVNQEACPARAREGGGSEVEGNGSAMFDHPSDPPNDYRAGEQRVGGRTSPARDGQDGSLEGGEGSSPDHIAAWCAHELGVGEGVVADALASCPRPDALNVARRLAADVRNGRVKVERSIGGLLRHRLREDPRHDPTPPPPWPPSADSPERRRRWEDECWETRARRQEAETRRRLREED